MKPILEAPKNFSDILSSAIEQGSPKLNQISKNNTVIKDSIGELFGQSNYQSNIHIDSSSFFETSSYDDSFVEKSDRNPNNNLDLISNEQENYLNHGLSDRNVNNDPNSINEPQEGSLYNETGDLYENNLENMNNDDLGDSSDIIGDRESSENFQTQQYIESQVNSNGSYHSFYSLIKKGELEVIKVTVPQETVEKIRGGTNSELKFVNDRKGNYWIVNWKEFYCLIPKEKTYINQYQHGNFQRIFECKNYYEDYSEFKLIKPATVIKNNDETWQLDTKGKIEFS